MIFFFFYHHVLLRFVLSIFAWRVLVLCGMKALFASSLRYQTAGSMTSNSRPHSLR